MKSKPWLGLSFFCFSRKVLLGWSFVDVRKNGNRFLTEVSVFRNAEEVMPRNQCSLFKFTIDYFSTITTVLGYPAANCLVSWIAYWSIQNNRQQRSMTATFLPSKIKLFCTVYYMSKSAKRFENQPPGTPCKVLIKSRVYHSAAVACRRRGRKGRQLQHPKSESTKIKMP